MAGHKLGAAAAAFLLCGAVAASNAPDGYSPISLSDVCARTSSTNIIPKLPRLNLLALPVSSDLGSYHLFDCTGDDASRTCSFYTGFMDVLKDRLSSAGELPALMREPAVQGSLLDYGAGVVTYSIVNLVIAVLLPVLVGVFICFRYFCCCCGPSRCSCLRCGTPWPTRKAPCCGFTDLADGTVAYPKWERVCSFVLMTCFVGVATGLVVVANLQGNYALTESMNHILAEGDALVAVAKSAIPPLTDFAVRVSSEVFSPALVSLNASLTAAVDVDATLTSLRCINTTIATLPNVTAALAFLTALQASTDQITGNATAIQSALASLAGQKGDVSAAVSALQGDVSALQAGFAGLGAPLAGALANTTAAARLHGDLLRPTATSAGPVGLVVAAQADLATVPRVGTTPDGGFPSVADLGAAAGAPGDLATPGTMQRMAGGNWLMEGDPAEVATLLGRLRGVASSLGALPNYTATAGTLRAIAARVADASAAGGGALVAPLRTSVAHLQAAVAALPAAAGIYAHLGALDTSVDAVDLAPIRAATAAIGAVVAALPPWDGLLVELRKVNALPAVLPCLQTLTAQLQSLNASLVALPHSLDGVTGLFPGLNDTLMAAVATVVVAEAQVRAANASVVGVDVGGYTAQIDAMAAQIVARRADFNVSDFQARVSALSGATGALDFAGINATLDALDAALEGVDQAALTAAAGVLEGWQASIDNSAQLLDRVAAVSRPAAQNPAGDYALLALGYCGGNSQFYCAVDGDCVVASVDHGPCATGQAGRRRCSAGNQVTACDVDADCGGGGSFCLADRGRADDLLAQLLAAQAGGTPPDMSAVAGELAALLASAGASDPAPAAGRLQSAQASVSSLDLAAGATRLGEVQASLGTFDTAAIGSALSDVQAQVAAVPWADTRSQVEAVRSQADDLEADIRPVVKSALTAVSLLRGVLFDELPAYLAVMSAANLNATLAAQGPSAMAGELATGVADRAVAYVSANQDLLTLSVDPLQAKVDEYGAYADKAASAPSTYPDSASHGAAYYFGLLAFPDKMVRADDPLRKYIFTDATGEAYLGGRTCATTECVTASLTALNSGPVGGWHAVAPDALGGVPSNVPISREHVFLLLWAPPVLAILLSIWAMFPVCCRTPRWKKVPASCAAGCMICQLPVIFLVTALVWPLMLLSGDVCATGPNIGANMIVSYGDAVCPLAGGTGTAAACSYSQSLPVGDDITLAATIDFPTVYKSVFTHCPPSDPVGGVLAGLASQVEGIPYDVARRYVGPDATSSVLPSEMAVKPALTDIVFTATNATGRLLAALLAREATEVLSCDHIHALIEDVKSVYCCDVLPPLFLYISCWYLLAWAMCCCGLPAACLGRKRFPKEPWGPAYEESLGLVVPSSGRGDGSVDGGSKASVPGGGYDASEEVDDGRVRERRGSDGTTGARGDRRASLRNDYQIDMSNQAQPGYVQAVVMGYGQPGAMPVQIQGGLPMALPQPAHAGNGKRRGSADPEAI